MTRHEVRGQQAVLGWGGKPEDSCFFTEPSDHSMLFNPVPQSTEMDVELGHGGLKLHLKLVWPKSVHEKDCPGGLLN